MRKIDVLLLISSVVSPKDSYQTAEVKVRTALRTKMTENVIQTFDMKSDPHGPCHIIYWLGHKSPRLESIRIDIKTIDKDMLAIMEVLET